MIEQTSWQKQALALEATNTMSRRSIAELLDVRRTTCLDFLRAHDDFVEDKPDTDGFDNSRILVISDLHFPYAHPKTFEFLQYLKDKYNPTRVVQVGDEVDHHGNSFHDSDPDLYSSGHELTRAIANVKRLEEMFPTMDLLDSNHGSMVYRKAKHHGIPVHCIKSYNEMLGVSDKWKWHNSLIIPLPNGQKVYFCHGRTSDGLKLSRNMACNVIQGHFHSKFNVSYWSNPENLFWSMQVGCMVDDKSLAMAYNRLTLDRPIIGCGVIINGIPALEAMPI